MNSGQEDRNLQLRLQELQKRAAPLEEAVADFDHQARRLGDRLERAGGRDPEAEQQSGLVAETLKSLRKELAEVKRQQAAIERRLGG